MTKVSESTLAFLLSVSVWFKINLLVFRLPKLKR
jgi:hypothetical protein